MTLALVLLGEMKRVGGQCIFRDLLLVVLTLGVLISPCTAGTILVIMDFIYMYYSVESLQ